MSLLKYVNPTLQMTFLVMSWLTFSIRAYQGLSSKAKLGVGAGLLAWGIVGLYLSDQAEEKYGFKPSEKDKAELDKMTPKIRLVDREGRS